MTSEHNGTGDKFIHGLAKKIADTESNPESVDNERVNAVDALYDSLHDIVDISEASIEKKLFEPFKSVGSVTVKGKRIVVNNPVEFCRIASMSDNLEVYSTVDSEVILNFTFHGLAK